MQINEFESQAELAEQVLKDKKHLMDKGIIEFEKVLVEAGVMLEMRNALIAYYLQKTMYAFIASLAKTRDEHERKFRALATSLYRDCIKIAEDDDYHDRIQVAMISAALKQLEGQLIH